MTWTIIYRGEGGTTQIMEVEAESRTDVYPILTKQGIHPLSIQPGTRGEVSGRAKRHKTHHGKSSGQSLKSRVVFLFFLLLLTAGLVVAWLAWIGPCEREKVREKVRPPGKVSIQIASPQTDSNQTK